MDKTDIIWNDFKQSVELHKAYLELAIKINMFYYAITGAILSFYFTDNHHALPMARYALGLPIILSIFLAYLFFHSSILAWNLRGHIKNRAAELALPFYPEGIVLVVICVISGIILALTSVALVFLFYFSS